ncbi:MAG: BatD family protein [Porticoccaceae bacterium]
MKIAPITGLIAALLLSIATTSWAELTAKVDRTILDANETLQLVIRYDGQAFRSQPDFEPLTSDFEILSNNRQQQYSRVNGQSQSYTDWNLILMPKRTGMLLVPSLTYKNDVSNALEITVRAASNSSASAGQQPVYTETLVDKDTAYIQEQIILTHRLYTSVQLSDLSLSELDIADVILQRMGETQYQKRINGRNYLVVEVQYALFPQVVGKLNIPTLRFGAYESTNGGQFGMFSNRGSRIFRNTESKTINIMPRPAHIAANQWMPSTEVQLTERWSSDLTDLTVGEPITRTIAINAKGLTGAQISPLEIADSDAYKSYPDQPQLEEVVAEGTVIGTRIETMALVPNRAGQITFPEIKVRWWDTANRRMQTTFLPAKKADVTAVVNQPIKVPPNQISALQTPQTILHQDNNIARVSNPLIKWSLALNALLIAMLVALVLMRKKSASYTRYQQAEKDDEILLSLKQKLTAIKIAAKHNNLTKLRDAILSWGKSLFPGLVTLKQLATLLGDNELQILLEQLDSQLYNNKTETSLDSSALVAILKRHTSQAGTGKYTTTQQRELKPLYPSEST